MAMGLSPQAFDRITIRQFVIFQRRTAERKRSDLSLDSYAGFQAEFNVLRIQNGEEYRDLWQEETKAKKSIEELQQQRQALFGDE